nr:Gag-Pol polyprotein [Tanacetum cinerariifolium]
MQTQTSNTLHNAIMEAGSKDRPPMLALGWIDKEILIFEGSPITRTKRFQETYKNVSQDIRDQLNAKVEAVQIILTGIDNDIYSTVDACPNDGESLESYYSRFYKMMNELIRNQCKVTNHQVNVQSQQAATRNRGKAIVNSPQPIYDQEPSMVAEDDETSKDKEIDKLMALISLSFKKIYKPINNNLQTSSNTSRINQDNFLRINRSAGECQKPKRAKDAAYHRENMLLNWKRIICTWHNFKRFLQMLLTLNLSLMQNHFKREEIDQNDDDNDLANERELLASLIDKLKCEIDEGKNRNKFLETSNKILVEKLKGEIEDFKNKNKSLESSKNYFKEANNKLSEINNLLYTDYKKSEAELARRNSMEYASQMEIECTKVRGDFLSYKMEYQKSCTKSTQTINDLNQTISEMKDKLSAHQETISILSQQKEAQIKLYKTREDKELDKVIALENKVKVFDNIVYKTGQSVQTMNMLNNKCRTSFIKPEFLKKAQRANPRLYDIELDVVTNLQCDYLELLEKCECLEIELSKSKMMSKSFESVQKHAINLELELQQLQAQVRIVRTDKGMEYLNQTLHAYSAAEGILHQTDGENLEKIKEKGDAFIFVGYSTQSRAYRVFNKRIRVLMETIHVNFDELPHMASDHVSSDPAPECQRTAIEHDSLSPGNVYPLTRIATPTIVPPREPIPIVDNTDKPVVTLVYSKKTKTANKKVPVVQIILWYLDSGCSKHMTGDRTQLVNFVQNFLGTVKFGNDHVAKIMGYGDYQIGN